MKFPSSARSFLAAAILFAPASVWAEEWADPMQGEKRDTLSMTDGPFEIGGALGPDGGQILSRKEREDGTKVLHGLQVILGPKNQLTEYAVYNNGALEGRVQFYPNGRMFRTQRRERNGDGDEVIWTADASKVVIESVKAADGTEIGPIKVQDVICQGTVKADKPWEGTFLVREGIPNEFGDRLVIREYKKGELVKKTPFPEEKLPIPEEWRRGWFWDSNEWPFALDRSRR